jgi:hypothetical protein
MGMEHWWNETNNRKPKFWEGKLTKCHFVQYKSHMERLGIETVLPLLLVNDCVMRWSVASNLNRLEARDFISWKRNNEEKYEVEMWTFEYV